MKYEIDQSGKIEQTSLNTVIALSNDKQYSVILSKGDKRAIQQVFRKLGKPQMFVYLTFAYLVAKVIKKTQPEYKVVIDTEYEGHEDMLKAWISQILIKLGSKQTPHIIFNPVGKSSPAHKLAPKVAHNKEKPNKKISTAEVLKVIVENKK